MASEVAAIEGRPHGIRVVVVEPGMTRTALLEKMRLPSKDGPYWGTMRNTFAWLAAAYMDASEPDVIARAVSGAVSDPLTPFRVAAGQWCAETIALRQRFSDEGWNEFVGAPTRSFAERYRQETGVEIFR